MTSAADLFALQEIDLRRDARRAVIADIESRLDDAPAVVAARQAVEDSEDDLAGLQRLQRNLDAKLADLDAKIEPLNKKLFDGSVRNPKELTDMQKELDNLRKHRGKLDDDGLELLEAVEETTRTLEAQRETLARAEAEWKAEKTALLDQKSTAEDEYAELEEVRGDRTTDLDRGALGLYESLRTSKAGRAVAIVERGQCQGCRITLPTHLVQSLRGSRTLVQCPNCERILLGGPS